MIWGVLTVLSQWYEVYSPVSNWLCMSLLMELFLSIFTNHICAKFLSWCAYMHFEAPIQTVYFTLWNRVPSSFMDLLTGFKYTWNQNPKFNNKGNHHYIFISWYSYYMSLYHVIVLFRIWHYHDNISICFFFTEYYNHNLCIQLKQK